MQRNLIFSEYALLASFRRGVEDLRHNFCKVGLLGQASPREVDAPEQYVGVGIDGRFVNGEVRSEGIAGKRRVWGNALGDGNSESFYAGVGGGRGLAAVQAKGQNKGLYHLLFGMVAPERGRV